MRVSGSGAAVLALALAACDGDPERPPSGAADLPDIDDLPRLVAEEDLRIGSVDDPDYGFSRISDVDVDRNGNVYVFEGSDQEIRVYSPEGDLLRRFGGPGEGPGEFQSSFVVEFGVRGDTVWVFEASPRRLTLFDRAGEFLSTARVDNVEVPLHIPGQYTRLELSVTDSTGRWIGTQGMTTIPPPRGNVADSVLFPRVRFDAEGRVVDTVGHYVLPYRGGSELVDVGSSRYVVPSLSHPDRYDARHADGTVRIEPVLPDLPGALRVLRLGHDGDAVRTRTFRYRPKRYPEEVLNARAVRYAHRVGSSATMTESGVERYEQRAEDSAAARVAILREMEIPEFQPPVRSVRVTDEGTLWLLREDMGGEDERWTVLDREDMPVGELEFPREPRIVWTDNGTIWAIERDELDVPWLVRYRIGRAR